MTRLSGAWLLATVLAVPACSSKDGEAGGPSGPSGSTSPSIGPCDSLSCSNNLAGVFVGVWATNKNAGGPDPLFTFTFAGLTLNATGQRTVQVVGLGAGEYEFSAQMITDRLVVSFFPSAGVRPVSVQMLDTPVGPVLTRSCNTLDWTTAFGTPFVSPQRVRLRVSVVSGGGAPTCLS